MESAFTLLDEGRAVRVPARIVGDRVELSSEAVAWLAASGTTHPSRADAVELTELASRLNRPLALDLDERVGYLGARADERGRRLASLEAPDFALPDLDGRVHTLAQQRGKKVLLVAWASW
jgi:hypothetical protein